MINSIKKGALELNPSNIAKTFREEIRASVLDTGSKIRLVGLLAGEDESSVIYSDYTRLGCEDVGVAYEARKVNKLDLETHLKELNEDPSVTGVIVYYPIFGGVRDAYLRGVLSPNKDVEGLHPFWLESLYSNIRFIDGKPEKKSLLPCTPLAVLKLLKAANVFNLDGTLPFQGKTVTIFNRSEVVGRPLAFMMSNDGAKVYSFDIQGPSLFEPNSSRELETNISRAKALSESDIIITGVPSSNFELIKGSEVKETAAYVNFSSFKNYSEKLKDKVSVFIPRVGPVTVAMCLRNVLRLHLQRDL